MDIEKEILKQAGNLNEGYKMAYKEGYKAGYKKGQEEVFIREQDGIATSKEN